MQHQSDPRHRSNLIPARCQKDDTNRVNMAARTPCGRCDRSSEWLESKSNWSPRSKLNTGNCVSDEGERNRESEHIVVLRRGIQNSASWNFFESIQMTACRFETPRLPHRSESRLNVENFSKRLQPTNRQRAYDLQICSSMLIVGVIGMSGGSIISLMPWKRQSSQRTLEPNASPTDWSLLAQFVAGDESAFASLMERHQSLVMSVCQRILREAADAEDAFQATFLVLARKARSLNWQDSIAGWLHQTARRTAMKLRSMNSRRQKIERQAAFERSEISHTEKNSEAAVTVHELAEILDEELERLPALFREVILLTQVEGLSRDETAQRLGISEASVKDRLERGRGQLRSRLVRRGITVSGTMLAAWLLPGTAQAASTTLVTTTVSVASVFASGVTTSGAAPAAITLAQGVLKMMGLEKLKFVVACVLSLITAGGVAYGMLHDNPQRFQKGLVGQIVDVQTNG